MIHWGAYKGHHKGKVLIHHIEVFKRMEDVTTPVALKDYEEITKLYSSYIDTAMGRMSLRLRRSPLTNSCKLFIIASLTNKGLHVLP